jgi:hypothetical protein
MIGEQIPIACDCVEIKFPQQNLLIVLPEQQRWIDRSDIVQRRGMVLVDSPLRALVAAVFARTCTSCVIV